MLWTKEEYNKAVKYALKQHSFTFEIDTTGETAESIEQLKQLAKEAGHVATIDGSTVTINVFPFFK